jgi:hypothetical protein
MISLRAQFRRVRRRLLGIGTATAVVWGLAAVMVLLLLGVWLDLLWEFSPQWRIGTFWAAGIAGAALLAILATATERAARDAAVARRLDCEGGGGGKILTGWELSQEGWARRACLAYAPNRSLTASLAGMAVEEAAAAARQVPMGKVAPLRPLHRSLGAIGLLWTLVALLAVCLPGLARTQWNRFTRPFADVPPFSLTEFEVTPGNKPVLYGSELEIRAKVKGSPVEQLELILKTANGQEPPLPMFQESGGVWRAVLAKVIEPTEYYVRAYRARSEKYCLSVITVPLIESGKVRIEPPAYANRAVYEGALPKDGVSGLPGTKVRVSLRSNRPLRGGVINVVGQTFLSTLGKRQDRQTGMSAPLNSCKKAGGTPAPQVSMTPTEKGSQEVTGEFPITADGKFECRVIDVDGEPSQQTFSGNVTMLADQRPFIRITQPEKMALATPTASLPVTLSAEDDCGISRLQLFRSLNDSRPLPCDLSLPPRAARKIDQTTGLALDRYGLQPGDVIKLFGRVEDNDPAGAKGAESSVVTVRIISQEEFERMMRTKQGLEEMLAKYDAARRRMENMAEKMEGLKKKLDKHSNEDKASEETRREINRLREEMRKAADEIEKSANSPMPYDLDKSLASELKELARTSKAIAKELEKLQGERDLINKKLGGKLDDMAKKLVEQRKLFDERAMQPMEFLAQVFPLMADQERFKMLAQWQQDLAERMAALKGHDNEDNPAMKARMRDLEQEQRQINEALNVFLENMQEHITKLPDSEELKELRETAEQFVKDVRESGASEAMGAAENALTEFSGTRAEKKAKEAGEILDKLIQKCDGTGNCAGKAMRFRFQPKICSSMGNSIAQLLAGMGMGDGGDGSGMSGEGMTGLYGGLPVRLGQLGAMGHGPPTRTRRGVGAPHGDNPDEANPGELFAPGAATGASEGSVPMRYRRQVGDYFERVSEETGEGGH